MSLKSLNNHEGAFRRIPVVSGDSSGRNTSAACFSIFFILLLIGSIMMPFSDAHAKNYIENGDFEKLGIVDEEINLDGWGCPENPPYSVTLNSSQQYSGEQSMRIGGITSMPSIELVWYPADDNGDPIYREFPICTRRDAPPPNGTPYESMEVKFGGYIGSIVSTSGAEIDINLEIKDDDAWSEIFTASDVYDLATGGWQHFSEKAWFSSSWKPTSFGRGQSFSALPERCFRNRGGDAMNRAKGPVLWAGIARFKRFLYSQR